MKLKYSASLALALWLCVVAWVSAMIVAKPTVQQNPVDGDGSAAIAQLQLNINNNRQALARLDGLQAARGMDDRGLAVAPAPAETTGTGSDEGPAGPAAPGHRLTMIVSTGEARRAVVDGQLVAPGTRLRDGSRIGAIGPDHVRLEEPGGQVLVLRMPAPFAAAADDGEAPR